MQSSSEVLNLILTMREYLEKEIFQPTRRWVGLLDGRPKRPKLGDHFSKTVLTPQDAGFRFVCRLYHAIPNIWWLKELVVATNSWEMLGTLLSRLSVYTLQSCFKGKPKNGFWGSTPRCPMRQSPDIATSKAFFGKAQSRTDHHPWAQRAFCREM